MNKLDLKKKAINIRDERNEMANTAERVGGLMLDVINQSVDSRAVPAASEIKTFPIKQLYDGETAMNPQTVSDAVLMKDGKNLTQEIFRLDAKLFPLSVAVTGGGVFEKGTTQTITVSWVVKKGDDVVTPDTLSVNGQPATGTSKVYAGVVADTIYNVSVTKSGLSKSASTSVKFVNPSYMGVVAAGFTATEASVKALTKGISATRWRSLAGANLVNQKVCYAYPKSFGALVSIKDANNFEYINSYSRSEITINGELYYVYILKNATSVSGFKQIFS